MTKDTGGYAFPAHDSMGACIANGMTLRDWFAGQALAAIISGKSDVSINDEVSDAYLYADAMIAERSKP